MSIFNSQPFTFVNGQTADATQVNANFNQVIANGNANAAPLASPFFTGTVTTGLIDATIVNVSNQFQVSGSPIATANLADVVADSNWTPTDASGAVLALTVAYAIYYKIGNLVALFFNITYPSTADSRQALIGGLPVAPNSTAQSLAFEGVGSIAGASFVVTTHGSGTTELEFHTMPSSPGSYFKNSDLSSATMLGSLVYFH